MNRPERIIGQSCSTNPFCYQIRNIWLVHNLLTQQLWLVEDWSDFITRIRKGRRNIGVYALA